MGRSEIEAEIRGLKQLLAQSDYKALKHADGAITDEEYSPVRESRESWRAEINRLEEDLESLPVEAPDFVAGTDGEPEQEEEEDSPDLAENENGSAIDENHNQEED